MEKLDDKTKELVLESVANGKSLTSTLKELNIPRSRWYAWMRDDSLLENSYARACADRADYLFDQLSILCNQDLPRNAKGDIDAAAVHQLKLKVDTLKWEISKLNVKKYGDKAEVGITGAIDIKATMVEYVDSTVQSK